MSSRLTASALFGLGLVVMTAVAQPPVGIPITRVDDKKAEDKAAEKKADPLDGLIGAALLHDADVQVARAKVQLSEAELAKARQAVTMKVTTLKATVDEQRQAVALAEQQLARMVQLWQNKAVEERIMLEARGKLEVARAQLARAETELKLVTGGGVKAAAGWDNLDDVHRGATWKIACVACHTTPVGKGANDPAVRAGLDWLAGHAGPSGDQALAAWLLAGSRPASVKGPVADRIRAALDKPVKLGNLTGEKQNIELAKAMEVFKKEAGLDVTLYRQNGRVTHLNVEGQSLPVGAWFQLFADANPDERILVREYGLLLTHKGDAPPDAVSVYDFWKQKAEKKEPPKAVEGQPKR